MAPLLWPGGDCAGLRLWEASQQYRQAALGCMFAVLPRQHQDTDPGGQSDGTAAERSAVLSLFYINMAHEPACPKRSCAIACGRWAA